MREAVTQALELGDFVVRTADHGLDALRLLEDLTPDLILSDVNMPHMNGIELFTALRDNPRLTSIPIIFLTANEGLQVPLPGDHLSLPDVLPKPVDPGLLIHRVEQRLSNPPLPAI